MYSRSLEISPQRPGAGASAGAAHTRFDTGALPQPLLAWRQRVGHIIDALPMRDQPEQAFHGAIERYAAHGLVFTDCSTGPLRLERRVARISTDKVRDFVFHVFVEGDPGDVTAWRTRRRNSARASILALDLDQPVQMERMACRTLNLFAPRALMAQILPNAEALHGRVLEIGTPLTRLLQANLVSLQQSIRSMDADQAASAIRDAIGLAASAFGKQAGLAGGERTAVRAAAFGEVRRRIEANLHHADASSEQLLDGLALSRSTVYRMFEHEGGLVAYTRQRQLRAAADELIKFPQLAVTDIAYGLGFKSASDFTRAFRRTFGMAPQDLRAHGLQLNKAA